MEDNKYTRLARNTAIFAVGTFGSKVLTFLIVPLYTYYLTTEEYGTVDLFTTTINLMLPFVTLCIQDAIVRFLIADKAPSKSVASNCVMVFLVGALFCFLLMPVYHFFFGTWNAAISFFVLLLLNSYNAIFSQYLRGIGKNVAFTVNGIIVTTVLVFSNVLTLIVLKMGVPGYVLSLILSQFIASIQATVAGRLWKSVSYKQFSMPLLKQMLLFCVPLIPNSLMWWLMSAGNKYMILGYMGSGANGIYSVSMKFPTILTLMFSIFMQAWQLSALEENDSGERQHFYENVFYLVFALLSVCASGMALVIKPFFQILISDAFLEGWLYVPLLGVAAVFNCLGSFCGIVYNAGKNTKKAFTTTMAGAATTLLANAVLIPKIGLYGVAIGSVLGYLAVTIIRFADMRKYTGMRIKKMTVLSTLLLLLVQGLIPCLLDGAMVYIGNVLVFAAIAAMNRHEAYQLSMAVWQKRKARK